tara:strand:- start:147 stop:1004 length:858 start_codon:yes stop_codon:yes gene_type:complete
MKTSVSVSPIGILGLGFLGKILASDFADIKQSWGTWNNNPPPESELKVFPFDWSRETAWTSLPEFPENLILTIPPILNDPEAEKVRLNQWGEWMNKNRPNIKRMIYISSTGVYPKRNGLWHEDSGFEPDTNSGKLRLITEKTLGSFFKLQVVRPGGIYGNGRGIDLRLKSGKHIPVSGTPVHRIHVKDLAGIVFHLQNNPESARCVNAVDFDPKPSWEVAHWLIQNREDLSEDMLQDIPDSSASVPGNSERLISNQRLIELGITLNFPTFREGMMKNSLETKHKK